MTPDAPWPELRAHIQSRLDPPGGTPAEAAHSDYDLNPEGRPASVGRVSAAVLAPLVEREAGPTVLLTRRSDALNKHAGQIAFPGGRCDPGETPEQTALREAEEEIGLPRGTVTLAGRSGDYQTVTGYTVSTVVGFVRPPLQLRLNSDEVAEAFEVPFALLMDPSSYQRRVHEAAGGVKRHYYAVSWEGRLIWGATAGMLCALRDRLFGPSTSSG